MSRCGARSPCQIADFHCKISQRAGVRPPAPRKPASRLNSKTTPCRVARASQHAQRVPPPSQTLGEATERRSPMRSPPHAAYLVASVVRLCAPALSACSSGARRALQPAQPAQPRTAWAACPARRRHIHRAAPGSATRMESLPLRHGCSCLPLIACTAELAHQPSHAPSPPLAGDDGRRRASARRGAASLEAIGGSVKASRRC